MKRSLLLLVLASGMWGQDLALRKIGGFTTNQFDQAAAEIATYDPVTKRLFFVNAQAAVIEALDLSNPAKPAPVFRIFIPAIHGATVNSVAVRDGILAAAVEASPKTGLGSVVFFDTDGNLLSAVKVGHMPDMITFTPDGKKVLTANEGEPSDDYKVDPEGSVSIIDISGGVIGLTQEKVVTAGFTKFNGATLDPSIRIFGPGATVAQDLEPEYIAVSPDSKTAWVTLQEANALGILDLEKGEFTKLVGLGFKDHRLAGNGIDASDRDSKVNIANWPVYGMYQPDTIAAFEAKGKTWLITANEGDTRAWSGYNEEARVSSLTLDPTAFPNAADLKKNENLGRLTVTKATGDTDGDGDFDALYVFGGRSFSIWDTDGKLVFDSGDALEKLTAAEFPDYFNASNTDNTFDSRSDNKGPEPEGLTVAAINGRLYAFIGLERMGGVVAYDVSDPEHPVKVGYVNSRIFTGSPEAGTAGDLGPEGVLVIPGKDSATGQPLLVSANEVSGSIAVYEMTPPAGSASVEAIIGATPATTSSRVIELDGSGSTGNGLTYQWRVKGPAAALSPQAANTPKVQVQFAQGSNAYTIELTVTDAAGASSVATVTVNYVGR